MRIRGLLFLQRRPPLAAGAEAFDLPLTAAAFDHEVTLLLLDDGVHWLRRGLPALVREAVDQILVERQSLDERGLAAPAGLRLIERGDIAALIAAAELAVGE